MTDRKDSDPGFHLDADLIRKKFRESSFPDEVELPEALRDAQDGPHDSPTLVECPACRHCELCAGTHMVTPTQAETWKQKPKSGP